MPGVKQAECGRKLGWKSGEHSGGLGDAPAALGHLDGWGRRRRHLGTEQGPPSPKESTHHWLGSKGSDPGTQIFSLRSPRPSARGGRWRAVPGREVWIVSQGGAPNLLSRSCDVRKVKNGRKMTRMAIGWGRRE